MIISQERVDQIHTLKEECNWSWATVAERFGWTSHNLNQVRQLKIGIADEHIAYLEHVRDAINAIPIPGPEVMIPQPTSLPQPVTQDIRVMLLDDIAARLAEEYAEVARQADASQEEISGARWMIGRIAERCGVAEEVRNLIQAQATLAVRRAPPNPIFDQAMEPSPATNFLRHGGIGGGTPEPAAPPADFRIDRRKPTIGNPFAERVPMED